MPHVDLENNSFISYEGVANNGHWNPGGAHPDDVQGVISKFRIARAATGLAARAHKEIDAFDLSTLKGLGKKAYRSTDYYPQLAWMALERSGLWSAMNELSAMDKLSNEKDMFRLSDRLDCAGLILPNGLFKMAAEMAAELVAPSQKIDWGYRTEECGGHNLLFLYAGNVVSKIYPAYPSRDELLVESFAFDPALARHTSVN